jgi:hypothetical protein
MWKPWSLVTRSHEGSLRNARLAATEAGRRRVERLEAEQYVARRDEERLARADRTA